MSCSAREIKGLGASHGGALPGETSLLPHRLGKEIAGILAHGGRGKTAVPAGDKGAITVAAGINAFSAAVTKTTAKGVVSDGSLGKEKVTYNSSDQTYTIPTGVGTKIGKSNSNLFESFSQFNLSQGQIADFMTETGVVDIIARITGATAAIIDGEIKVPGTVNLFLIDPSGVFFDSHASLAMGGAFTVSTADRLYLAGKGLFDARGNANDALTTGVITGFGFVGPTNPAPVAFRGSQLQLREGKGINIIAGNVSLSGEAGAPGAALSTLSGQLTIFSAGSVSAKSVGLVNFQPTTPSATLSYGHFQDLGAIRMDDGSSLTFDGVNNGRILVHAGTLLLNNATIDSVNAGSTVGAKITIGVEGGLYLQTGGHITAQSGKISVTAGALDINGLNMPALGFTGIGTTLEKGATGNGGDLMVTVTGGPLNIVNDGGIVSNTYAAGKSGDVTVTLDAGALDINGANTPAGGFTGIETTSQIDTASKTIEKSTARSAGNIQVTVAGLLHVQNAGQIVSQTYSSASAGTVNLKAENIIVSGNGTQIEASSAGSGPAGNVTVNAAAMLTIENAAKINCTSSGSGKSGNVSLTANSTLIESGGGIDCSSAGSGNAGDITLTAKGIKSTQVIETGGKIIDSSDNGSGQSGRVTLEALNNAKTQKITLESGGEIEAYTDDSGKAGAVTLSGLDITITGIGTQIESTSSGAGQADSVNVTAKSALAIESGGGIDPSADNAGNTGSVTLTAPSITIAGLGTQVESAASGSVEADTVAIHATGKTGDLTIESGAKISSSTDASGKAGMVTLLSQNITVTGQGTLIEAASSGSGEADPVMVTASGKLTVQIGAKIESSNGGSAAAGAVVLRAHNFTIAGQGGQVVSLTDESGNGAEVEVKAPVLAISGVGSGIFSESTSTTKNGAAGALDLTAGTVQIDGAGEISSSTVDALNAGILSLTAQNVTISGKGAQIASSSSGSGPAADVSVSAHATLIEENGEIDSISDGSGNAGDVTLTAMGKLNSTQDIESGAEIMDSTSKGSGDAGSITLMGNNGEETQEITISGNGTQIASSNNGSDTAGVVSLIAQKISISGNGKQVDSSTTGSGAGGEVKIEAQSVGISGMGTQIFASTDGPGFGGEVNVTAPVIGISGALSGIGTETESTTQDGAAGEVAVNADFSLAISDGGQIKSSTDGLGSGGEVNVAGLAITISGAGSGIFTESNSMKQDGSAGALNVTANALGTLEIETGGEINSSTQGLGDSGEVTVRGPAINITGAGSGIFTESESLEEAGAANEVAVTAFDKLKIDGGGEIESFTEGPGSGGLVKVDAPAITVSGASGISAQSMSGAQAGNVSVTAGTVTVDGGGMTSYSSSAGGAGNVTVSADITTVENGGEIGSLATDVSASGNSGDVMLGPNALTGDSRVLVESGGKIDSTADGSGVCGKVDITATGVLISGAGISGAVSEISTICDSTKSGDTGGGITIDCTNLALVTAGTMNTGGKISSSSKANGGNIDIQAGGFIKLSEGSIYAYAADAGANIAIATNHLSLQNSNIKASTGSGADGILDLYAGGNPAYSGSPSDLKITSPYVQQTSSMVSVQGIGRGMPPKTPPRPSSTPKPQATPPPEKYLLPNLVFLSPAVFEDPNVTFQETCAISIQGQFSSFMGIGQGDIEAAPDEALAETGGVERRRHEQISESHAKP